jgi:hypothetical protein
MIKVFTQSEKDFIWANYPEHGMTWVAERLGKTRSQIRSFVRNNKITRNNYYKIWSPEKIEKLIADFPHRKTEDIAAEMGFPYYTVSNKAYDLQMKKTTEFMAKHGQRLLGTSGVAHRYPKGHVPANKGKKMPDELKERIKHTFFQPGQLPATTVHFGKPYLYERIKDGNVIRLWFIQESTNKRSAYLAYLCHQNNIDLTGKKPILKPGFDHSRPPTIDDIEIVTNAENMLRNTIHNYPEEIKTAIRLSSKLNKLIRNETN